MNRRRFIQSGACLGIAAMQPLSSLAGNPSQTAQFLEGTPQGESVKAIEIVEDSRKAQIGIVAVGGAGGAIISKLNGKLSHLSRSIAIDTDQDALRGVAVDLKILLGSHQDSNLYSAAAKEQIAKATTNLDLVFIVAGMGGATGTAIAPLVAQVLKEKNITTVGAAITPTFFDVEQSHQIAQSGLFELSRMANSTFRIANGGLASSSIGEPLGPPRMVQSIRSSIPSEREPLAWLTLGLDRRLLSKTVRNDFIFSVATSAFEQLYRGITVPFSESGLVTVGIEDIKQTISDGGRSALGFGSCRGSNAPETATYRAITHPLLGERLLRTASIIFVSIEGSAATLYRFKDINTILTEIRSSIGDVAHDQIIFASATWNETLNSEFRVTILAVGVQSV